MIDPTLKHLVAVLAAPPQRTSGDRTRQRVNLAAQIIGCDSVEIVNLLDAPTGSVLDISTIGAAATGWLDSRRDISDALGRADALLIGWGQSEPSGPARTHHRSQVDWLFARALSRQLPIWTVGGTPRHPSRWQRYTSRVHPGLGFTLALKLSLARAHLHPSEHSKTVSG